MAAVEVWVVAGCLFEISVPVGGAAPWRWAGPGAEVTLLSQYRRGDHEHFRFRTEAAGARAGTVQLRFDHPGGTVRSVTVRIAPEAIRAEGPT